MASNITGNVWNDQCKQDFHESVRAPQIPQGSAGEVGQRSCSYTAGEPGFERGLSEPDAFACFAPPRFPKQRGI